MLRDENTAPCLAIGSIYLHQTFTEYVYNQYTHSDILKCQRWLQAMEHPLILFNAHILICQYIRYDCKLWKAPCFCCIFCEFSHIVNICLFLILYILTKYTHNVCLTNTHILIYQNARCDCKVWSALSFNCVYLCFL